MSPGTAVYSATGPSEWITRLPQAARPTVELMCPALSGLYIESVDRIGESGSYQNGCAMGGLAGRQQCHGRIEIRMLYGTAGEGRRVVRATR